MGNCADVCIDHDYDGGNEFYCKQTVTSARREHRCCECGETIGVGSSYQRESGKSEGDFFAAKTCARCAEIRSAFVCGSWIFGDLWTSITEEMFPVWQKSGPIDCLAKLTTKEARDFCIAKFREWSAQQAPPACCS